MNKNQEILTSLKNHLSSSYRGNIKDVILFGSRAKGISTEYSDYDVLVILSGSYSGKDENTILDLCYDIDLAYDILLDVHIISESELGTIRGRQPIFTNAIKTGIYA